MTRLTAAQKKERMKENLYRFYQRKLKEPGYKEKIGEDDIFAYLTLPRRRKPKKYGTVTSPGQRRDKDYGFKVQKRNKKFMTGK